MSLPALSLTALVALGRCTKSEFRVDPGDKDEVEIPAECNELEDGRPFTGASGFAALGLAGSCPGPGVNPVMGLMGSVIGLLNACLVTGGKGCELIPVVVWKPFPEADGAPNDRVSSPAAVWKPIPGIGNDASGCAYLLVAFWKPVPVLDDGANGCVLGFVVVWNPVPDVDDCTKGCVMVPGVLWKPTLGAEDGANGWVLEVGALRNPMLDVDEGGNDCVPVPV